MKSTLLSFIALIICGLNLSAQTYNGSESVEFDAANNRYLVSNTGSGQILARAANGTLSVFKSGISPAPYGLEILGNTVYACCGGSIKGFDLTTGNEVFTINLGAQFLNGITSDGMSSLFATDFSGKKLFRIRPAANAFNLMAQNLVQSPNGIVYDLANNRLVFVNWGANAPIKEFSFADSTVSTITTTTLGNCDGLAWNGLDTWYISAWTGQKIVKFDRDFANAPVNVQTGMSSPADIYYNQLSDTLAVPNSGNNTVVFIGFAAIENVPCSLLPLSVDADSSQFIGTVLSFGDSVLRVRLTNNSGLNFAYPQARLTPVNALPAGMTFGINQDGFNVFASSWNSGESAYVEFYFNVASAIAENTILDFQIDVTNLIPSSADTCFFSETFSVDLNPGSTVGLDDLETPNLALFPNPADQYIQLQVAGSAAISAVELIDLSGRSVYQASGAFTTISTTDIPSGLYILRAKDQSGRGYQQKLSIRHN
jgi:hypothetical protein